MEGGFFWDSNYELRNNNLFNLSPTENFIRTLYWYNFLLHSEKVNSYDEIENLEFKEYLKDISTNIFNNKIPIQMYKQTLPKNYNDMLTEIVYVRNVLNPDGSIKEKVRYNGNQVHDPTFRNLNLYNDSKINFINTSNFYDIQKSKTINYNLNQLLELYNFHLNSNILIPFLKNDERYWLTNKITDVYKKPYIESHISYSEFLINKSTGIKDTDVNSKLYWIDIYNIHFKHTNIVNGGQIDKNTGDIGYTILDNIKVLKSNPNFYTQLMKNVNYNERNKKKLITPLKVFFMDGLLYSHDHKRVVASIVSGNRYVLGMIDQKPEVIYKREIGYRPMKCVFSKNDKSLILRLRTDQISKFGNYFFVIGNDFTDFMDIISKTKISERNKIINKELKLLDDLRGGNFSCLNPNSNILSQVCIQDKKGSYKTMEECIGPCLNKRSKKSLFNFNQIINNKPPFNILHFPCNPSLFNFLNNKEYIQEWYLKKIKNMVLIFNKLLQDIKSLSITQSGNGSLINKSNYKNKYLKYLHKYNNLLGGSESDIRNKIIKLVDNKIRLSNLSKSERNDSNSLEFKQINQEIYNLSQDEKELFSKIMKSKISNKDKQPKKPKPPKAPPKQTKPIKDIKYNIIEKYNLNYKNLIYIFLNNTVKRNLNLVELEQLVRTYINFFKKQYIIVQNYTSIEQLIKWELKYIGNSFWYIYNNKFIHPALIKIINIKYPFLQDLKENKLPFKNEYFKFTSGTPIRYSKTDHPELEDLVLLLRTGEIGNIVEPKIKIKRQLYSEDEILLWQKNNGPNMGKKYKYLQVEELKKSYPSTDGKLNYLLIDKILKKQEFDHIRIDKINLNQSILSPPIYYYGALQGLSQNVRYQKELLFQCPEDVKFVIHLTKKDIIHQVLAGVQTKGSKSNQNPKIGHIDLMGRYIHGLAYVERTETGFQLIEDKWNPFKRRLFNRFKNRVGVIIDMEKLKQYYDNLNVEWKDVCGINKIYTVIFLKPIPPHAIIARDRVVVDDKILSPGTTYNMNEMFNLK